MGRLLLIAFRNLLQSKKRTILVGGAIGSVTGLLVLLTSVSNGIQSTMMRTATTLATGHVNVGGFYKITSGQAAPVVTKATPLKELVRKTVPDALVVDRVRGWGKVVSDKTAIQVGYHGIDIAEETGFHDVLQITTGDLRRLSEPNTVMIFEGQAKRLGVSVGDKLELSALTIRGASNAMDVTVVAIAKDIGIMSGWSIFTPKQTVRDIYMMDKEATGAIQIYLPNADRSDEVAEHLRKVISEAGYTLMDPLAEPFWMKFQVVTREEWTGQRIDITTWKEEMKFLTWSLDAFSALTWVLVTILLIIIVVGVMNTLWMSIRERTREIGTLRAIGMGQGSVLVLFVLETFVLSVSSSIVGALAGALVAGLLNWIEIGVSTGFQLFLMRDTLHLVPTVGTVALSIAVISLMTTLLGAVYPAYKASRMRPVTAIQHVG